MTFAFSQQVTPVGIVRDMEDAPNETDGRRARRQRGRQAVIDALLELLDETGALPGTEAIVERSGVSLSSVFRYFESIDELQEQTIEAHLARAGPLFEIPDLGRGSLDQRIATLVDARLSLHEAVAPVARLARSRAPQHPRITTSLDRTRAQIVQQVRDHFSPELAMRTSAAAEDLALALASLTAFEAWDLLVRTHGRSRRQIRRAWISSHRSLLAPPSG